MWGWLLDGPRSHPWPQGPAARMPQRTCEKHRGGRDTWLRRLLRKGAVSPGGPGGRARCYGDRLCRRGGTMVLLARLQFVVVESKQPRPGNLSQGSPSFPVLISLGACGN